MTPSEKWIFWVSIIAIGFVIYTAAQDHPDRPQHEPINVLNQQQLSECCEQVGCRNCR